LRTCAKVGRARCVTHPCICAGALSALAGKFREGECTLRMKADMKHPMACMWDLVAYRIQYRPHPHVGDKWCIYPTYDYTHCIIDSLENITHSLCTLEFESRRESYFWLLDKLDLYKPTVWEYSRLNVEFGVMSKRIIKYLVEHKLVAGWDDPRLLTLNGLRRRGYTPAAINLLCEKVGVTRNDNMAQMDLLEHCVRSVLDDVVPRAFVVKDPVPVVLANYPADKSEVLRAPVHPKKPDGAMRELPFSRVIYIDREDFRKEDEKDFYRLAPNKTVHLRFGYDIHCTGFKEDASGRVTEIQATVDTSEDSLRNAKKHKGVIHWVAEKGAVPCELRLYDLLFTIKDPAAEKDWIKFMNPKSLVVTRGFGEPSIAAAKSEDKFQFERVGYFNTDYDSRPGALIFNLTCGLKDTKGKT
jgi:glutaminyl-tRNA synthetase